MVQPSPRDSDLSAAPSTLRVQMKLACLSTLTRAAALSFGNLGLNLSLLLTVSDLQIVVLCTGQEG